MGRDGGDQSRDAEGGRPAEGIQVLHGWLPACQSFSKLSDTRGVDAAADPRSRLVSNLGSLLVETRPSAAVFENVPWMASGPGRAFLDAYIGVLGGAGCRTVRGVVDASRAGAPHSRRVSSPCP